MSGITGILNLNRQPAPPVILKRMTEAIAHRGPDGEGQFIDSFTGLGHRRLATLDLSPAAQQPMSSGNGLLTIVCDGLIYNFQELRRELENLGRQFRTKTDVEVMLQAYEAWGPDCLNRFNGMFALAIWDQPGQKLFLARDRYGTKPLYYAFQDQAFLFGSEQKAILAHPASRRNLDCEALLEYFTFQNIFTDKTLLKGLKLFPAGCYAFLGPGQGADDLQPRRYWDFNFREPDQPATDEEYMEELDRLFKQAVSRQLIGEAEVGTFLSGGMDSGSITAVAAGQLPEMKTFTCGCDLHSASGLEMAFDEREKAEFMSYHFKTEHYEMILKAGDMERVMPSLAWHLEEPRVGQSYPNYYAAKLASKFVKVVLSGGGGDEMFAGYPWRYYRAVVNADFDQYIDKYYLFWQRLIPNTNIREVFKPIWKQVNHVWTQDIFRDVFPKNINQIRTPQEYVNHSLYFEAKTFLHGLLVVDDKLSSAHGLETRMPFLDNDLADFAMRVPIHLKLKSIDEVVRLNENEPGPKTEKFFSKTKDGKLLLRQVMSRYIPREISWAVKQGFSAPDSSWFKGDSIDYVRETLYKDTARIYEYFDKTAITRLMDDHLSGRQNRRLLIWSLLNFEHWLRQYLS